MKKVRDCSPTPLAFETSTTELLPVGPFAFFFCQVTRHLRRFPTGNATKDAFLVNLGEMRNWRGTLGHCG
jgi:hypothetical protein